MHHLGQAACVLDAEGHFLNASPSLAAFFHCDGSALCGQSLLARMDTAEADQVAPLLRSAARGAQTAFQLRLRSPGGAPTWVRVELRPGGRGDVVACFSPP